MYLAYKFLQDSDNNNGIIARNYPPLSKLTESRMSYEDAIEATGNVDNAVTAIAQNNYEELCAYVQHNGETPIGNPIGVFIQAVFIRLKQIAYVAKYTDSPEIEALHLIEDEETENVMLRTSEGEYVLGSDVQAAIKKSIEEIKRLRNKYGKSPALCGLIEDMCIDLDSQSELSFFDYFGDITQADPLYNTEYWNDESIQRNLLYPEVNDANGGTTVYTELDKLLRKIGEAVQPVINDVTANSVSEAIKRNIPIVLLLILVLGAVIYFSVYAARKKP